MTPSIPSASNGGTTSPGASWAGDGDGDGTSGAPAAAHASVITAAPATTADLMGSSRSFQRPPKLGRAVQGDLARLPIISERGPRRIDGVGAQQPRRAELVERIGLVPCPRLVGAHQ